jgi:hypothetical protein
MGRQILFHMLWGDCQDFLAYVTQSAPVLVIETDKDSSKVEPLCNPCSLGQVLSLWNQDLLPVLKRKYIPKSAKGPYYRVDSSLPVVEFSIPREADWEGSPSLTQGRIYASFDQPNEDLTKWFDSMSRWIRKNFAKNPVGLAKGYIGPAALRWYQEGGILLPFVRPLPSPYWISFVNAQHGDNKVQ